MPRSDLIETKWSSDTTVNEESLTPKDYAGLEAQRRGDFAFTMKVGAIEGLEMSVIGSNLSLMPKNHAFVFLKTP